MVGVVVGIKGGLTALGGVVSFGCCISVVVIDGTIVFGIGLFGGNGGGSCGLNVMFWLLIGVLSGFLPFSSVEALAVCTFGLPSGMFGHIIWLCWLFCTNCDDSNLFLGGGPWPNDGLLIRLFIWF